MAAAVQNFAHAAAGGALETVAGAAASPSDLDVMTFNLRYASDDNPNSWASRRPIMSQLLNAERPQLIGTQEGLSGQLADIKSDLGPGYEFIGQGREGGTNGEYSAIFYDSARLTPQDHKDFWLSDTPEVVGSNTWGGGSIRMVTWARFLDKVTGAQFYAVNTHLDNFSADARQRSADLIRQRIAAFEPKLPVVLTGDFNGAAQAGNAPYDILTGPAGLTDAWTVAPKHSTVFGTFHDYKPFVQDGPRIDWVLTSPQFSVLAAAINTHAADTGQLPSDHLPVELRLHLN